MVNISKTNLFLLIICAIEYPLVHHVLFPSVSITDAGSVIIFLQAFLLIGILGLSKFVLMLSHFLGNLILVLLEIYHRIYDNPITLTNITQQYREGTDYLLKTTDYLIYAPIIITIIYFLLTEFLIFKYYDSSKKSKRLSIISMLSIMIIGSFMVYQYRHQKFRIKDFNQITEFVGYGQGWLYEFVSGFDEQQQINYVIKMAQEPAQKLPSELKDISHHNHIYVVQLESFQYAAFEKEANGKKVMPFLQSLKDKAAVYKILPTQPHPSANSDFAAMHGIYDVSDFYYVIYQSLKPNELYQKIEPITLKYHAQGYNTGFYHGYYGHFYGRRAYVEAMKFDEIYFAEDLKDKYPSRAEEWGISDVDMAEFIIKNQQNKQAEKSFSFFITVSTHDPYEIGKRIHHIYEEPNTLTEKYYNAFNFADSALKTLIDKAPQDSLFIMYSDHPSIKDLPMNTFFMVYSKKQNLKEKREIDFSQAMQIIKSLLENNLKMENN